MTGHLWQLDDDGDVDTMAMYVEGDTTGHNGPLCTACGYTFCVHCAQDYKGRSGVDNWESECAR